MSGSADARSRLTAEAGQRAAVLRDRRGSRWGWNIPQESWLGPRLPELTVRAPGPSPRGERPKFAFTLLSSSS